MFHHSAINICVLIKYLGLIPGCNSDAPLHKCCTNTIKVTFVISFFEAIVLPCLFLKLTQIFQQLISNPLTTVLP